MYPDLQSSKKVDVQLSKGYTDSEMTERKHSLWFHLFDVLLNIVIILGVVVLIRTFLVSPFQVEGNSMISTLEDKEYIIINKLAYYIGEPKRGDIVVLRPPADSSRFYVKRVIGIPGDEVVLRDGHVMVKEAGATEFVELKEPYLNEENSGNTYPTRDSNGREKAYTVPDGHYFVLGDNRVSSSDSRSFPETEDSPQYFVPDVNIKGRVWFVLMPITKIHALEPPVYGF